MDGIAKPYVIYNRHGRVARDGFGKTIELTETEAQTRVYDSGGFWEFFPGRGAIRFVGSARPGLSVRPNAKLVERYAAARASNPEHASGPEHELIATVDGAPNRPEGVGATGGWRKSGN